jgi:hypothetical protein
MLGFLAFPVAGVATGVIASRIDSAEAAVIGGAIAGRAAAGQVRP